MTFPQHSHKRGWMTVLKLCPSISLPSVAGFTHSRCLVVGLDIYTVFQILKNKNKTYNSFFFRFQILLQASFKLQNSILLHNTTTNFLIFDPFLLLLPIDCLTYFLKLTWYHILLSSLQLQQKMI